MRFNFLLTLIFLFNFSLIVKAQKSDIKSYDIKKIDAKPKIDGILNEKVWDSLPIATGFVQFDPGFDIMATLDRRTEVKLFYNENGIYLSAKLYDDPQKMMTQITQRDDFGQTDFFRLVLNPNNDAQNDSEFIVFSSGTQADALSSPSLGRDFGWNAVWDSGVKLTTEGWQLEMKIPYRSLRFPDSDVQTWGIQFRRSFRRERSEYAWNRIDPTKGYSGIYHGQLTGLKDLKPPLRLNLFPFTTAIGNLTDGDFSSDLRFGMDIKYGITDNITLDATLVPDFSQVGFDNLVLNLGPFEQTFAEQRQFFTEGVELFNRGNLFFSRRVGSAPTGDVDLDENEIEVNRPNTVDLINAVKVSGRLKSGLGVGLFNAITEKTTSRVVDTLTQESREVTVEPFTNYNILVVDQQFNKNSSVTLINTNTTRKGDFRDANVTGALFDLQTKANTYRLRGQVKMSHLNLQDGSQTGLNTNIEFAKVFGNFRYRIRHDYADDDYDINDLGLIFRNNFNNFTGRMSYEIFEPTDKLQTYRVSFRANYRQLAIPSTFTGLRLDADFFATSLNLTSFGFNLDFNPGKRYDYFEPRTEGRFFISENFVGLRGFISTNYNNVFAIDVRANANTFIEEGRDSFSYRLNVEPRVRFNDKFFMVYEFTFDNRLKDRGFATKVDDEPIFGQRDRKIITNSIRANYNFDSYNGLSLQFRHYLDTVLYDDFMYELNPNGRISINENLPKSSLENNPDVNFNTWNVDLNYVWQFAPGSFLTVLYRQQLFQNSDFASQGLIDSLDTLFNNNFQHTVSIRLQYFIDVNEAKNMIFNKS